MLVVLPLRKDQVGISISDLFTEQISNLIELYPSIIGNIFLRQVLININKRHHQKQGFVLLVWYDGGKDSHKFIQSDILFVV